MGEKRDALRTTTMMRENKRTENRGKRMEWCREGGGAMQLMDKKYTLIILAREPNKSRMVLERQGVGDR